MDRQGSLPDCECWRFKKRLRCLLIIESYQSEYLKNIIIDFFATIRLAFFIQGDNSNNNLHKEIVPDNII